ncbi:hypothetical protein ACFLZ1_01685 [Patescibacteria group bacterium]
MVKIKTINLSKDLKVKPKKVLKFLKVKLGSKVKKGDIIALKKGLLGKETKIFSLISGVVDKLEEATGILSIRKEDLKKPLSSPKVSKVKNQIKGIFGFGKSKGEIVYFNEELSLEKVTSEFKDKILVTSSIISKGVIFKSAALGLSGLVLENAQKDIIAEVMKIKIKEHDSFSILALGKKVADLKKFHKFQAIINGEDRKLVIL